MTKCISTVILIIACLLSHFRAENELVPTYFARKFKNGSYIDATIKSNWLKVTRTSSTILLQNSNAALTVDPALVRNSQYVNVSWKDVQKATAKDFIALYCPETSKDNDYYDFFNVDKSSTYSQGYGEYSVQLYNVRTNCEMRYFRYISKEMQEFVTKSNIVMFEGGPEQPLQIHLALTGDPTEMRVMWVSGSGRSFTRITS